MKRRIVLIGDIQAKLKQPYWNGIKKLFDYWISKYKDDIIITTGDLYEISAPNHNVKDQLDKYILQFHEFYSPMGNHDYSKAKGNALLPLNNYPNVFTYSEVTKVEIAGLKVLFIPFTYIPEKRAEYNKIKGQYDIVVPHMTPQCYSFGQEYWDVRLEASIGIFWGHIHHPLKEWNDELENKNYIVGTPQPTRELEEKHDPRVIIIDPETREVTSEALPKFMTIETVLYGTPLNEMNPDYLYNITDAPDEKSVKEMYADFYIRDDGIELRRNAVDVKDFSLKDIKLKEKYKPWAEKKEIPSEIQNETFVYMDKVS